MIKTNRGIVVQEKDKVSIIVPVYNSESYIERCIQSIVSQSYNNLEIIIVDDGSTDNSVNIIKTITSGDNRVKMYYQDNNGPSSARNLGIDKCTGNYLLCVDSDDTLEPDAINTLVKNASFYDVIVFGMKRHDEDGERLLAITKHDKEVSKNEIIISILFDDEKLGGGFTWNKFWNLNRQKDKFILFDEELYSYEDKLWCISNYLQCEHILLIKDVLYNYYRRLGSLSNVTSFDWKLQLNILKAYKKINKVLSKDTDLKDYGNTRYQLQLIRLAGSAVKRRNTVIISRLCSEKINIFEIIRCKEISTYEKVKSGFIVFFLFVKKMILNIFNERLHAHD